MFIIYGGSLSTKSSHFIVDIVVVIVYSSTYFYRSQTIPSRTSVT